MRPAKGYSGTSVKLIDQALQEVQEPFMMDLEICFQIDCGLIGEFHLCGNERAFIDNQTGLNCQSFFLLLTVPNKHTTCIFK